MEIPTMSTLKLFLRASLVVPCMLALTSAAFAQDKAAESKPAVNPYLHDSHNPISHENPAQTDAVSIPSGTTGRTLGADDAKVLYTDIETSHHIIKNFGNRQVAYFSGAGVAISKVDVTGENFKLIHRTMLPGHEAEPPSAPAFVRHQERLFKVLRQLTSCSCQVLQRPHLE